MKKVLCHGCFDLLHIGHVMHLQAAKAMGDYLVVSVTADEFVNKGAGRPIYSLAERMEMVGALGCVDEVIASEYATGFRSIIVTRPDIFCKGADYEAKVLNDAEVAACRVLGIAIKITSTRKYSTTEVIRKCASL